jgi:hypothetical protein
VAGSGLPGQLADWLQPIQASDIARNIGGRSIPKFVPMAVGTTGVEFRGKYIVRIPIILLCMSLILSLPLIGCDTAYHRDIDVRIKQMDKDVFNDISKFATNEDEPAQEAWARLSAYRREDLLASLMRLRTANSKDDILEVYVAFVLCNLDHEYEANRRIIVTTFNASIDHAGRLQGLIARLIKRGDEDLLPVLFEVTTRSDGDLSEGLADTFSTQMQEKPEQFLLRLKAQPSAVRRRVYELVSMGMPEGSKITSYLSAIPKASPIGAVAKEMLAAISK